jgi:hypothetical protein
MVEESIRELALEVRALVAATSARSPLEAPEYRLYLDERRSLIDAQLEGEKAFDQAILVLAGGAFGLSIVLVTDLFKTIAPGSSALLRASWFCFGGSLLATLVSFVTSSHAYQRQLELLDRESDPSKGRERSEKNWYALWTRYLNIASLLGFICGIGLMAWFTSENFAE